MATEYLSEVRSELNSRSQRTTLEELKKKGLDQVRVIRSSQILQLIERAVEVALARRGEKLPADERSGVVEDSSKILKEMMRAEMEAARALDHQKLDEMRSAIVEAQEQMAQMQAEVAAKDAELNETKARTAELDAELRVIRTRAPGSSPTDLLDELKALRQEIHQRPAAPAPAAEAPAAAASAEAAGALAEKLASLGAELSNQIERIGRKVGVAAPEDDNTAAELANLYAASIPELESNMDSVESEERKGSDVSDALARMKSIRKAKGGS